MLRKVEISMFLAFDRIKELADKQKISLNILEEKLGYSTNYLYSLKKGNPKEVINEENIKSIYNLDCKVCYNENDKPYIIPKT